MDYAVYTNPAVIVEHVYFAILMMKYREESLMNILEIFSKQENIKNVLKKIGCEYSESLAIVVANSIYCFELIDNNSVSKTDCLRTARIIINMQHRVLIDTPIQEIHNMFMRNRSEHLRTGVLYYLCDMREKFTDIRERDCLEKIIYAIDGGAY